MVHTHSNPRPFIITTPSTRPDQAAIRNGRSYAMRGKNTVKKRKPPVNNSCPASWIDTQPNTVLCQDPKSSSHDLVGINQIPRQLGSEWTLFHFAEEISPYLLQNLFKFFGILEQATYPNQTLAGTDLGRQAPGWFHYLGHSQAYLHTQLFVVLVYSDIMGDGVRHAGPLATVHMIKALGLLRNDLTAIERATTGATISSIIALAMVAFMTGDAGSAKKHMYGLFKLVAILGGLGSLKAERSLQIKCSRLDLSYAISTCSKPFFFADDNISWNSYLPRSVPELRNTAIHILLEESTPDYRLVNVYYDLYEFSRAANIATQTSRKLDSDLLHEVMISVQYRLLHLQYDDEDAHELLRVVMLAFSITILPIIFSQFGPAPFSSPSLPSCLRALLRKIGDLSHQKLKVILWILVIIRISILDDKVVDFQLGRIIQALNLSSWVEILEINKSFLWIDVLHKEQAKGLFYDVL